MSLVPRVANVTFLRFAKIEFIFLSVKLFVLLGVNSSNASKRSSKKCFVGGSFFVVDVDVVVVVE